MDDPPAGERLAPLDRRAGSVGESPADLLLERRRGRQRLRTRRLWRRRLPQPRRNVDAASLGRSRRGRRAVRDLGAAGLAIAENLVVAFAFGNEKRLQRLAHEMAPAAG